MLFYAEKIDPETNKGLLGSDNEMLFELKTEVGARRRVAKIYKNNYSLFSYTNAFDETTYKEIVKHVLI